MTPEDVCRFFAEVKTQEETLGKLNYLYIGDEDFWFECRSENDFKVDPCAILPPGDRYTINFYYYYPDDLFEQLFVANQYGEAMKYLLGDYFRLVGDIRSEQDE